MKAGAHLLISIICFVHLVPISADCLHTALACESVQAGIVHKQESVIPPGDKNLAKEGRDLAFRTWREPQN